ncbi:unnamed protein product [Parascedosporium putredinis]|uniref:Uncharacterized protein n=1 Tax=Parascedosporium putredinis TaxID=1442378 RepID=A0A9P1H6T6_9PEZI|nr:unnamed protein product [Parascedosporium putredinis]CAI7997847.1 unnamed protein product [Parascedosporium putredinis]
MSRGYATATQARMFVAPTAVRRADFVQELYLRELKAYKTPVVKESDADAHVQVFNEYESMAVEVEGADAATSASGAPVVEDWLETEETEEHAAH